VPFDVFISHASKDKTVANAVCARLEAAGIRCWIAPRDIVAGTSYGEAIIDAIHAAKIMVLVFSANANASAQIPKEIERAVSNGVAILPFRIEDVAPGKSLDYFIGSVHWLDAMTPPMEKHLDSLAETVHKLLGALSPVPIPAPIPPPPPPIPAPTPAASSKAMLIGIAAALVLVAVVLGVMLMRHSGNAHESASNPMATNPPDASDNPNSQSPSSPRSTARAGSDPIVGCYQWFNNGPVVIRSNHSIVGGPITGHWQLIDAASQAYALTWERPKDTVTVAPNQLSLSGTNSYGPVTTGARRAGFRGLVGTWRWENGATVVISQNGQVAAGSILGTWQPISVAQGTYTITWMAPIDSVNLVAGGSRISGKSNYGVDVSGMRTEPCDQN
jgi:hypothetical protein